MCMEIFYFLTYSLFSLLFDTQGEEGQFKYIFWTKETRRNNHNFKENKKWWQCSSRSSCCAQILITVTTPQTVTKLPKRLFSIYYGISREEAMRNPFYYIHFRVSFLIAHNYMCGMRMYIRLNMQGSWFSDPFPSSYLNTFGKNSFQILFVVLTYNDIFSTALAFKVSRSFKAAISHLKGSITMPTRMWVAWKKLSRNS